MRTRMTWLLAFAMVSSSAGLALQVAVPVAGTATRASTQVAGFAAAALGEKMEPFQAEHVVVQMTTVLPHLDDQEDPSYKLYKEGYKLILDEKWMEARGKFNELISRYAKSKYTAEAQYWMAYSWKYSDKKKAIEAYKAFLKKYPSSSYYDDATADLGRLENPLVPFVPPPDRFVPPARSSGEKNPEAAAEKRSQRAYYAPSASGYSVSPEPVAAPVVEDADPKLKMKVEAFQALIRSGKDQKTLDLVKEMLLDPKQPKAMRATALYALKSFDEKASSAYTIARDSGRSPAMRENARTITRAYDGFDLQGFYLQVLKADTSTWLSQNVIYQLGSYAERGDERVITQLKQIAVDGKRAREVREAALFSLRSAKRPDVLELYGQVAKTDPDAKLRLSAIYQIGQASKADEEAAFKLLQGYATDKNQKREMREAALFSLKSLQGNKAASVYLEAVKADPDERIQQMALHYFVEASKDQPEMVFAVLKDILQDRSRPWSVRETAINQIARIGSDEAFNLLVSSAKTDPEERIRVSAVNYIGHFAKNRSKSLAALISLFQSIPNASDNTTQSLLYAIASIGNDEAVEFLGKIAKTHESYSVRQIAIQYLGNIGGEQARAILVEIMHDK